jgi:hypothetical protein
VDSSSALTAHNGEWFCSRCSFMTSTTCGQQLAASCRRPLFSSHMPLAALDRGYSQL